MNIFSKFQNLRKITGLQKEIFFPVQQKFIARTQSKHTHILLKKIWKK